MFNFFIELLLIIIVNSILNPVLLYFEIATLVLIIGIIVLIETAPKDKNVGKKGKEEIPGKLTPIIVDKKEYSGVWEKLKGVLDDDDITNIAITGEYGTGKTSFLKSFFRTKNKKNYKFISVPNFIKKENSNETKNENLEIKLDKRKYKSISIPSVIKKKIMVKTKVKI